MDIDYPDSEYKESTENLDLMLNRVSYQMESIFNPLDFTMPIHKQMLASVQIVLSGFNYSDNYLRDTFNQIYIELSEDLDMNYNQEDVKFIYTNLPTKITNANDKSWILQMMEHLVRMFSKTCDLTENLRRFVVKLWDFLRVERHNFYLRIQFYEEKILEYQNNAQFNPNDFNKKNYILTAEDIVYTSNLDTLKILNSADKKLTDKYQLVDDCLMKVNSFLTELKNLKNLSTSTVKKINDNENNTNTQQHGQNYALSRKVSKSVVKILNKRVTF